MTVTSQHMTCHLNLAHQKWDILPPDNYNVDIPSTDMLKNLELSPIDLESIGVIPAPVIFEDLPPEDITWCQNITNSNGTCDS